MTASMPNRQAGFTLIEVLVASSVGLLLILAMFHVVGQSVQMSNAFISQITLNQEARATFDLMGEGGVFDANDNGSIEITDETERVAGYRGRFSDPLTDGNLLREAATPYRLTLKNATGSTLLTASVAERNVNCISDGDPVPDCLEGDEVTVDGFVGANPESIGATRNVGGDTPEVRLTMMDPNRLPVDGAEKSYVMSDYVQIYWTTYTQLVDY